MNQASLYLYSKSRWTINQTFSNSLATPVWTELPDSVIDTPSNAVNFEMFQFFDKRARDAANLQYMLMQKALVSMLSSSAMSEGSNERASDPQSDLWVDMPPRSKQKVVMRLSYTGKGKPLAILDTPS